MHIYSPACWLFILLGKGKGSSAVAMSGSFSSQNGFKKLAMLVSDTTITFKKEKGMTVRMFLFLNVRMVNL